MSVKIFLPFPLGKTGGLIEAHNQATEDNDGDTFPLGKTGGLIEASVARRGCRRASTRFRWVKPAASLKPHLPIGALHVVQGFRWVKPAASLKQDQRRASEANRTVVSAG